jgi:hypothetical protein
MRGLALALRCTPMPALFPALPPPCRTSHCRCPTHAGHRRALRRFAVALLLGAQLTRRVSIPCQRTLRNAFAAHCYAMPEPCLTGCCHAFAIHSRAYAELSRASATLCVAIAVPCSVHALPPFALATPCSTIASLSNATTLPGCTLHCLHLTPHRNAAAQRRCALPPLHFALPPPHITPQYHCTVK